MRGAALLAGASPYFIFERVPSEVWQQCQLLYLCSPGNPTGAVVDATTLQQLIELADRHDFIIASDECYSELYPDEKSPPVGMLQVAPLACPQCGGELKIVAFLTEADPIQRILIHIGEPATPPRIAPTRGPPDWLEADLDQTYLNETEEAEPVPEFDFDQTLSWQISKIHFSVAVAAPMAQ